MSAPGAVVLSSSPPRIFARSPTPVDLSPSLPSPADIFALTSEHGRRFRLSKKSRDGFNTAFSRPSNLLGPKKTAENIPVRSPGRERFKCSDGGTVQRSPRFVIDRGLSRATIAVIEEEVKGLEETTNKPIARQEPSPARLKTDGGSPRAISQVQVERATPRRTDWTPTKEESRGFFDITSSPCLNRAQTFPDGLLRNFGFPGSDPEETLSRLPVVAVNIGTRHQRMEIPTTLGGSAPTNSKQSEKAETSGSGKLVSQKRNKPPAKKTMTITKLSTSLYSSCQGYNKPSAMMQYLNSSQARAVTDDDADDVEHLVSDERIAKRTQRKPNTSKGCDQKAKVVSPRSAIKAVEAQATVFGSASQLAQDDEAVPQPQLEPCSTQQTQPISIESTTPHTGHGTLKFVRSRNLWSVSARDEDNALLHVDSVDSFDTPYVRAAFAGKDVLLEPNSRGFSPPFGKMMGNDSPIDIDAFESPPLRDQPPRPAASALRSFHTSARIMSPTKAIIQSDNPGQNKHGSDAKYAQSAAQVIKKPAAKKPSYAGVSTCDLQKQISSFGFKPIKKREKMIELLDQCWEAKHGQAGVSVEKDQALKHGDFLSNVHDLSNRPEPKGKKPRKRTKAEQGEASPTKVLKRQRKSALSDQQEAIPKKVRKKKCETRIPAKADMVEIEGVDSGVVGPSVGAIDPSDYAFPMLNPSPFVAHSASKKVERKDRPERVENGFSGVSAATPPPSVTGAAGAKIYAAIMRQSDDSIGQGVDHVQNPTWHDKILQFDPVILEDLTAWLNTEGLGLVNEDEEVSAIEVRDWCERNGICCLWKGGWRGQKITGAED